MLSRHRQHSVAMLEQCCNYSKQCRNNVATLCHAKNSRRCESSRYGKCKQATTNFCSLSKLESSPQEINYKEIRLYFTLSVNWNKRDKV